MSATGDAILLDTDVFSLVFVMSRARRDPRVEGWREIMLGRSVTISFQTRAETLAGAHLKDWGQARIARLQSVLDATPTIPADNAVIDAFARLTAGCSAAGHPLHQKQHTADRWIAASAIVHDLPLLSGDDVFVGAPGLRLLKP